ncbi:tRNA (guanosine(37)-N1)-methyltransferase TrmD [Candidatus Cytomitobacter indipagum]|uniref:tRNA (guanine-N(1)-)-methyltransferase n=1 Tax=Candidatus Cytomitobacter indipagum TaxID=2601575 RepID=A0A5C0UF58_9PROT|nr:tRNA (guanosine(37)-N1)-methyltransferase TrmD [Candidatus Cytomitobacter indipagum]QEK38273.1 tRNA (guanosine(37)-N1)-methyltransferase TrmD [Candidatus Cytomitobacter indipagum]
MWNVNIGTIFPDIFPGTLGVSCLGKAHKKYWELFVQDFRNYANDKHNTVDDTPFGGGPGMVMKCNTIDSWLSDVYKKGKIIYMSPRGRTLNQSYAKELIKEDLYIICGRYEGVDCRVLNHWNVEEVSMGDYVLCGGEVASMALVETCARLIPGVLGNKESAEQDSFSNDLLEHDQYTKPNIWVPNNSEMSYNTPCVLRSGNHKAISDWKLSNSEAVTEKNRYDLWIEYIRKKEKNVHS